MVNEIRASDPCGLNKGRGLNSPEFDKTHMKKAEGYIGQNVLNLRIKLKTIVRKP